MAGKWWLVIGWLTVLLVVSGCGGASEPSLPTATPIADPLIAEGALQFQRNCGSCHALDPDTVVVGPSMAGIATRAESREEGLSAREYLITSVLKPSAYVVEGFEDLMPTNFGKSLSGEELDAIVAFMLTLE